MPRGAQSRNRDGAGMGRPEKFRLGDILVGQKVILQENLRVAL